MGRPKGVGCADYSGERFARLTGVRRTEEMKGGRYLWVFKCDCGNELTTNPTYVLIGDTKSCGCLRSETLRKPNIKNTTHGLTDSPTWNSYRAMLKRCYNKKHHAYDRYGGRGILVCKRWHKFENFLKDMGLRPTGMTLDRIDCNGSYKLDNCRWADWKTQNNNRRRNGDGRIGIKISWRLKTLTVKEWSITTGVSLTTIYDRFKKGWPPEDIFSGGDFRKLKESPR